MSWSQTQQTEDLYDQMSILIGSGIRLLCGEAGVFVTSNEAFDPQSSPEYTMYQLNESALPILLANVSPTLEHPLVVSPLSPVLAAQAGLLDDGEEKRDVERCSLFVHDQAGALGILHYVRPAGAISCFERPDESEGALHLFITHLAAGLRSALKSQSLMKEQRRLAAIFQNSAEGILTVDTAMRIIDFNPAMERLTGWNCRSLSQGRRCVPSSLRSRRRARALLVGTLFLGLIFPCRIFVWASASIAQHGSDPYPNSTGQPGE
jgi:PAS domain-containing protein